MNEEPSVTRIHRAADRILDIALAVEEMQDDIGRILFAQTKGPKIVEALFSLRDVMRDIAGQVVDEAVSTANQSTNSMFTALLAGVAMGDPENAPTYARLAGLEVDECTR